MLCFFLLIILPKILRNTKAFKGKSCIWCMQGSSLYWWVHTNSWRREWDLLYTPRKTTRCYMVCFILFYIILF